MGVERAHMGKVALLQAWARARWYSGASYWERRGSRVVGPHLDGQRFPHPNIANPQPGDRAELRRFSEAAATRGRAHHCGRNRDAARSAAKPAPPFAQSCLLRVIRARWRADWGALALLGLAQRFSLLQAEHQLQGVHHLAMLELQAGHV